MVRILRGRERDRDRLASAEGATSSNEVGGTSRPRATPRLEEERLESLLLSLGGEAGAGRVLDGLRGAGEEVRERGLKDGRAKGVRRPMAAFGVEVGGFVRGIWEVQLLG
jgi:hypothetical protein